MGSLIVIELVAMIHADPIAAIVSCLALHASLGSARSKRQLSHLVVRLSTGQLS